MRHTRRRNLRPTRRNFLCFFDFSQMCKAYIIFIIYHNEKVQHTNILLYAPRYWQAIREIMVDLRCILYDADPNM